VVSVELSLVIKLTLEDAVASCNSFMFPVPLGRGPPVMVELSPPVAGSGSFSVSKLYLVAKSWPCTLEIATGTAPCTQKDQSYRQKENGGLALTTLVSRMSRGVECGVRLRSPEQPLHFEVSCEAKLRPGASGRSLLPRHQDRGWP
jgi:hypothetical protein